MRRAGLAALAAVVVLTGCAKVRDSRVNPFNWFGRSQSATPTLAPSEGYAQYTDRRGLVGQIVSLQVDRAPGGAIVTAIGLPPTQGWWDADLIPETKGINDRPVPEKGVITLNFRLLSPPGPTPTGTPASRELSATYFLSDQVLDGVRTITVKAQQNQRSSRR